MQEPIVMQRIRRGDKFDAKTKADLLTYVEQLKACKLPGVSMEVHAKIAARLDHARKEHPRNGGSYVGSLKATVREAEELVEAWQNESIARVEDENLDVCVCSIRFANREFEETC